MATGLLLVSIAGTVAWLWLQERYHRVETQRHQFREFLGQRGLEFKLDGTIPRTTSCGELPSIKRTRSWFGVRES